MKTKKIVFENRKGERKVYVPGRFEDMSEEVLDAIIDSPKFREDLAKADGVKLKESSHTPKHNTKIAITKLAEKHGINPEIVDAVIAYYEAMQRAKEWDRQHWGGEYRETINTNDGGKVVIEEVDECCIRGTYIPPVVTSSGPWSRERMDEFLSLVVWAIVILGVFTAGSLIWYLLTR